jgi:uncharacterized Zn finger protein
MRRRGARLGPVARRWEVLFERVDPTRLRRGRALARSGAVTRISVADGWMEARVRSAQGAARSYRVTMPCIGWWAPFAENIARWFVARTDWFAAWLAGEWPEDLLTFLDESGLSLFPGDDTANWWMNEVTCDCPDYGQPCKHAIAAVCQMVQEMEQDPPRALEFVGIPRETWLETVHRLRVELAREWDAAEADGPHTVSDDPRIAQDGTTEADADNQAWWWPEEITALAALQPAARVAGAWRPVLDPARFSSWRTTLPADGAGGEEKLD